jgi:hypothetical protein
LPRSCGRLIADNALGSFALAFFFRRIFFGVKSCTTPYLSSGFISGRCDELLRAYQDADSLVYQHELEVHELHRHLEAARLHYLQQLSSCATLRSMGVSGEPARLLVQELEDCRLSIEGFSRYLAGRLPNLQIYLSACDRAFSRFLEFEVASEEDRRALRAYLDAISAALFELESRFLDSYIAPCFFAFFFLFLFFVTLVIVYRMHLWMLACCFIFSCCDNA